MTGDQHTRLVAALHEHATGLTAQTAAVELITAHHLWLTRSDFGRLIGHGQCPATGQPMAWIRWQAAVTALNQHRLPCSPSEAHILRIAASLAAGTPVRLRDVLGCLDHRNITLVTKAIALANDTRPINPGAPENDR